MAAANRASKDGQAPGGAPSGDLGIRGVAHDVRQMLGIISGRAGLLLKRSEVPEPLRKDLQAIVLAAQDAAVMLKRLPGGGGVRTAASAGPTGLAEVARQVTALVQPPDGRGWRRQTAAAEKAADGSWSLTVAVPEDAATAVPGHVLREVLVNLVTNALEAMPDGGNLTLALRPSPDGPILEIADTGKGFGGADPEEFFRDGAGTRRTAGRGVGLAACRQLLAPYAARLTARAGQPTGAVLELELPPAAATDSDSVESDLPDDQPRLMAAACPVKGVLVVDDEEGMRQMLADVLRELGWEPLVAATAAEGLKMFAPDRCSVALVDYRLPDLSGLELAERLRRSDPRLGIVLMTGWANEEILQQPGDGEFDLQARKPLSFAAIEMLVGAGAALYIRRRDETAS